ncbi:flagellin [Marinagarivorans cellulosilyticus]|uniref:Flagellin n=1 Tax=Marinagarivorans cellulosilyticus TaxID=2721545 RepID=A0AAN1WKJ9_9GAMM|nr:flagellin [Marinagarivorans cellulosilyticus]BCD99294.1 flagellin [Marinagarivorans cellulosilyticus]
MPLYINTNVSSLNAQRQLNKAGMGVDTAMERLSSGSRINSAADDAAGLAISNRQTSQIRGLDQAVRNANDGISLIQTAEGALSETTNILQRMRELSIQSANGIYGDNDRATLDAEVQQLVSELDRIAETTSFNGQNILDGSTGKIELQVGAQANQTIGFEVAAVDADTLGMGSLSADVVSDEISATFSTLSFSDQDVLINGQAVGAISAGSTVEDLVTKINDNVNGVTAETAVELTASSVGTGVVGTTASVVTLTNNDGTTQSIQIKNTDSLQEYADAVNEGFGGRVSATIGDDGKLSMSAEGAKTLAVTGTDTTGSDGTAQAKLILTSDSGDDITIKRGATGTMTDLNNLGFREMDSGGVIEGVGLVATSNGANESLTAGDLTINGTVIDHNDTDSLQGKIDNINDVSDQTGVTAKAYSTASIDMTSFVATGGAGTDNLEINGIQVDLALSNTGTTEDVVTALNTFTDQTGVSARLQGTNIILESDQGAINISNATANTFFGSSTGIESITKATITTASATGTFAEATTTMTSANSFTAEAGLKLVSENGNPISVELKDGFDNARLGLKESNNLGEGSFGTSLSSISIDTAANAQKAISVIDNALETVNDIRSDLGAASNRLDFTISNLSNVSENTSAARSRIMDADFAAETAALSRSQVLQQASQAMLAQANSRPQQVLSLLQ